MTRFLLALFCTIPLLVQAQVETRSYIADPNLVPREHTVDFTHLKLDVRFEPEAGKVIGTVTHTFTVLRPSIEELELDGIRMNIKKATLDGEEIPAKAGEKTVLLSLRKKLVWDTEHTLTIEYECTPRKGLYFIGWNDPKNLSRKQIWTQGQGIDNRHWIPMYDEMNDKVVTEMLVTFPSQYKVLSNGELLKQKSNKDGTTLWHYQISHPHAPYLIMLGIGDYAIKTVKSKSGVPINLWYYPDEDHKLEPTYRYSVEMFDWFEQEIGVPFPWKNYSQIPVQDFMFGAMENTTATLFGDFYYVDERAYADKNYVRVNAHELAHQWFGDMITARSSAHHWLQESFATHYDMTYQGVAFGEDHFDWVRRTSNNLALEASQQDVMPIAHSQAGTTRHYPKGAFVLQMLKYVVGREAFNKSIMHYLESHPYENVDSEDLLIAFHETLGISLDWFWEQWVYRGGEPEYNVAFLETMEGDQRFGVFEVEQVHQTNEVVGLFKMPIWFEVHLNDGTAIREQVWIEKQHETVKLPIPARKNVEYVLFDPNSNIMKSGTFKKTFDMWQAQALKAEHMLDRFDAVYAMRNFDRTKKEALLKEVYSDESFHLIKEEILLQSANWPDNDYIRKNALIDHDPLVNQAALKYIDTIDENLFQYAVKLLDGKHSYWTTEQALQKLCLQFPEKVPELLDMTSNEVGFRGRNIRVAWLGIKYEYDGDASALQELKDYVSVSYDFQTRTNAAEKLQQLEVCDAEIANHLFDAIVSTNSRLSGPCGNVLQHFYGRMKYHRVIDKTFAERTFEDWQRQRIKRYMK